MRLLALTLSLSLLAAAQTPPLKLFSSSADVAALIAEAKKDHKPGQALVTKRILQFAPYVANLEYRESVGPAAVHQKEAEIFYVLEGDATMVTGGKLMNETRINPENPTGTGIEGGMSRPVSKGDFIVAR